MARKRSTRVGAGSGLVAWALLASACGSTEGENESGTPTPLAGAGAAGAAAGSGGMLPPGAGTNGGGAGTHVPAAGTNGGAGTTGGTPPVGMADIPAEYYGEVMSPAGIPADCQGFKLDGLRYSPGDASNDALPNKCEPFHPTTNNPYAVRCIDAWSHYKTDFPGDEFCILPPPPDEGIQFGVHPQGPAWFEEAAAGDLSGYQVTGEPWALAPGEEETRDFVTRADNAKEHNAYRSYFRMRIGSHHDIITSHENDAPGEEWLPGGNRLPGSIDASLGPLVTGLGGAQRPDDSVPMSLEKPPEDAEIGLYRRFPKGGPGGALIVFNLHHFNPTRSPILKEAWTNFWWENDARTLGRGIFGLEATQITLQMTPGEVRDLHYVFRIAEPTRALQFFGHRHAWTPNFSSWVERGGTGAPEIVYQSFDWYDVPTYRYDSVVKNPAPDAATRNDGGHSGVLTLAPGDELHFNCHVEFTDERASAVNLPSATSIGTLGFANEAFDAEMCILFGGVTTSLPPVQTSTEPVPDFAR